MRRRLWARTVAENLEWLSSPENFGLVLPAHHLFRPGLSKSAGCKCCGGSGCTTCTCCRTLWPALKLTDSLYGTINLTGSPPSTGTNSSAALFGSADCAYPAVLVDITGSLVYTLSCTNGTPPFVSVTVTFKICLNSSALADSSVNPALLGTTHLTTTHDSAANILTTTNCSSPLFNLAMAPQGFHGYSPYWNGATITIQPQ